MKAPDIVVEYKHSYLPRRQIAGIGSMGGNSPAE
jgi:hypothetical protein